MHFRRSVCDTINKARKWEQNDDSTYKIRQSKKFKLDLYIGLDSSEEDSLIGIFIFSIYQSNMHRK